MIEVRLVICVRCESLVVSVLRRGVNLLAVFLLPLSLGVVTIIILIVLLLLSVFCVFPYRLPLAPPPFVVVVVERSTLDLERAQRS